MSNTGTKVDNHATILVALTLLLASVPAFADDTLARLDPNALQQHSWQFYTRELDGSMGVGGCGVRATISVAGRAVDESVEVSSTLPKLDLSCLRWVHYFCWLPATHDGQAVQSSVLVHIIWTPTGGNPPVIGRVAGEPREIFLSKPGTKSCIQPRELERAWMP